MPPLALLYDQHADEIEEAIAKERERCAQVCIQLASMHRGTTAEAMREAAILIRRGPELWFPR